MHRSFAKIALSIAAALSICASLTGCADRNEWTVSGRITDADGATMLLEACDNGRWYALDSVKLDASGRFSMSQPPAGYPDIYRLRLGDKTLYFPIDSIETVTVISRAGAFDSEYELEGSESAQKIMQVDRRLRSILERGGVQAVVRDSMLKRDLGSLILGDRTGIVSYYIINKRLDGVPIFDPANRSDLRVIGAVANAFDQNRPNDPRTSYLRTLYLRNHAAAHNISASSDTIHAPEIGHFDMRLYDEKGREHSLTATAAAHPLTLLNFTVYDTDGSAPFNLRLHEIYKRYHDAGLEIYQVSVDDDEYVWKQTARNLPWITVYNSPLTESRNLLNYNVREVPVSFLIDSTGQVVERIENIGDADEAVRRHLR